MKHKMSVAFFVALCLVLDFRGARGDCPPDVVHGLLSDTMYRLFIWQLAIMKTLVSAVSL